MLALGSQQLIARISGLEKRSPDICRVLTLGGLARKQSCHEVGEQTKNTVRRSHANVRWIRAEDPPGLIRSSTVCFRGMTSKEILKGKIQTTGAVKKLLKM